MGMGNVPEGDFPQCKRLGASPRRRAEWRTPRKTGRDAQKRRPSGSVPSANTGCGVRSRIQSRDDHRFPKEVKDHESRVGVTPAGVKALTEAGHEVLVEHDAGLLSAMPDDEYQNAGAEIVGSAYDVWRLPRWWSK